MKRFLLLFFGLTSLLSASNLAKIYLNQGLEAVGVELEKELTNKKFWLDELSGKDLSLGYYNSDATIVVTNKTEKTFKVFFYKDGKLIQQFDEKVGVTGLMGDKEVEGDLKTPIGFYDLGKRFDPPSDYYGVAAFATNYPNLLDRVQNKTGGGIWIHGYPLSGERLDEVKTRGCIALYNDVLNRFAKFMERQKETFAMTEEQAVVRTNADEIATILASLFSWKDKWRVSDIKAYLEFYDEKEFKRFDKKNFKEFAQMKKAIFSKNEKKSIKFSNISVSPYPNLKNEKIFRITYYQDYYTANYQFRGNKTLYVKLDTNNKMKILVEQ